MRSVGVDTQINLSGQGYDEQAQLDVGQYQVYAQISNLSRINGLAPPLTTVSKGRFTATIRNLQRATTYYLAVVAVDADGNFLPGVTTTPATTSDIVAPAKASTPLIEPTADQIKLSWTPPQNTHTDLNGYKLNFNNPVPLVLATTTTSHVFTGLTGRPAAPPSVSPPLPERL